MDRNEIKYLFLIIVIFIAACIETDIYLPAFPDMMNYFSVSEEQIQSLLTWNFIGICISGPLYGPISDAIGRKKPTLIALGLFLAGSVMTLFAHSYDVMLWGRLLQGIGSGGCFTLGTAIVFDSFREKKAISAINLLNLIIPFVMALAPMLGGYLNLSFGFRSNFLAIGFFVLASLLMCLLFLGETLPQEKRAPLRVKKVLGDFRRAFSSAPFWQLTIVLSLMFAGYLTFLSGTAVLFVVEFGVSKQAFPFFQAATLIGWLAGSLTCTRATTKFGMAKVKLIGIALSLLGGVGFIAAALLAPRDPYFLTSSMMFYALGCNWINAFYFPESMELLPEIKGVTASLINSARLLITAGVVGLAGVFYNGTIYPLVAIMVGIIAIMLPTIILYEKRSKSRSPAPSPDHHLPASMH